jgi:hypothetical protein
MDELGLRFMDHSDGWSTMDLQPRSGGARPALGTKPHRKDTEREERERGSVCVLQGTSPQARDNGAVTE